jgi:hypothetical protein
VTLTIRDADGVSSAPLDLRLRHVLDTGFHGPKNAYSFLNMPTPRSDDRVIANLETFGLTYGWFEVDTQFLLQPTVTTAWYIFYRWFFNQQDRPGYSSGFSMTAAEAYWSGNPDLYGDHADIKEVEDLLTIAQGHILSQEILTILATQAAGGTQRAHTSLNEVEQAFRSMIAMSAADRRRAAPIMQLMPAGTILTSGFADKLSSSHGLLPIRTEWPVSGETWDRRLAVYDNSTPTGDSGNESFVVETVAADGTASFVIEHYDGAGQLYPVDPRSSDTGWTLSQVPLEVCWLSDVSIPLSYAVLFSPATLVVEDAQGRRFGRAGSKAWDEIPGALAPVDAPGCYLLPLDEDLTLTIHGTGDGTYTFAAVAGPLGRSVALMDVPVTQETVDRIELRSKMSEVRLSTTDNGKPAAVVYGVTDGTRSRALRLEEVTVTAEPLTLNTDLARFAVQTLSGDRELALRLITSDGKTTSQHRYTVEVGDGQARGYSVDDWADLDRNSLTYEA